MPPEGAQSWHNVSPDSLSTSFEMVPSDPEHKTPTTNSPPEDPLPSHKTPTTKFPPEDPLPARGSPLSTRTTSQSGSRSKVNEVLRAGRSGSSGVSPVVTIQHSGGSGGSGDRVIVTGGHDQQHTPMTSAAHQEERGMTCHTCSLGSHTFCYHVYMPRNIGGQKI